MPAWRLIALVIVGSVVISSDEPAHKRAPKRMIPGEPRASTLALALSPDGKTFATTRTDGRFLLCDESGIERVSTPEGAWAWTSLAFSPDGRFVAVGRDGPGIAVFDLATAEAPFSLHTPLCRPRKLAFSPDRRTLAAIAEDGHIVLWDLAADHIRMTLRGRSPAVDIAFSPDGRALAAGERDFQRVTLWDLETGQGRSIFNGAAGGMASVAFSPDGALLAAASPISSAVWLWDLRSGRLRLCVRCHAGGTNSVAFTLDGQLLVTAGGDGMIRIWKADTAELIAALDCGCLWQLQVIVSADGRIAAAGSDNHIRVWDLNDIDEVKSRLAKWRLAGGATDLPEELPSPHRWSGIPSMTVDIGGQSSYTCSRIRESAMPACDPGFNGSPQ